MATCRILAQLVGGALGMAYGVTSTTALVSMGMYPVIASASVHTAQIFGTLISGGVHFRLGNVRRDMILPLALPGVIGGVTGAYVAVNLSSGILQVAVGTTLLLLGLLTLFRFAFRNMLHIRKERSSSKMLVPLGYSAAFLDALGGGGWGPIVTTALIMDRIEPRKAIGSVNFTKSFITFTETITFMVLIGLEQFMWMTVIGLALGSILCAPISSLACQKLPHRILGTLVGATVIILSTYMIIKFFGFL